VDDSGAPVPAGGRAEPSPPPLPAAGRFLPARYDAIVLGLGAMGSAAAFHLARRGRRVLGLDAHPRGHALGSSHGTSRIIREAYFEAPEYVPLVRRAYALWRELEAETGRPLLRLSGGLNIGRADGELVPGALASARAHGVRHEALSAREVNERFLAFRLPDELTAIFEPTAGVLRPEAGVAAHLDVAARHGVELRHGEPTLAWSADGDGVRVETSAGAYLADRLVVAAGPWAGRVLAGLGLPLEVWRVYNVHFRPTRPEPLAPDRCPVYMLELPDGFYYGFPDDGDDGVKVGRHDVGEPCTPETARRDVSETEVDALRSVFDHLMPGLTGPVVRTLVCLYTMTPDRHFVVDRHPAHPQVAFACGFSGHGYKFAPVIGEALADLATEGDTRHPIGFLSARRFAPA
jgi:sarcosine oxidase